MLDLLEPRYAAIGQRITALESNMDPLDSLEARYAAIGGRIAALEAGSGLSHFDRVAASPHKVFSNDYNTPADYPLLVERPHYVNGVIGVEVFHDPEKQATRWLIPKDSLSIGVAANFLPRWPKVTDDIISVQWEYYCDPATIAQGGKAFNMLTDQLKIHTETQHWIIGTVGNYKVLPSLRIYGFVTEFGSTNNQELLSIGPPLDPSVQMGPGLHAPIRKIRNNPELYPGIEEGGTVKYVYPGRWNRYTLSWDLSVRPARLKMWIDDTLTICDPNDPSKGFIYDQRDDWRHWGAMKMPEFNNSSGVAPVDVNQWVRNVVVWKGAEIPRQ